MTVVRSSSPTRPRNERPTRSVDRAPGELGGPRVRRLDHTVLVEPHHRVGQVVEQLAQLALGPRQFVDRAPHAATQVARLEQRRQDRDDRHHADRHDGQHTVERRVGADPDRDDGDQHRRHDHDRDEQPSGAHVLSLGCSIRLQLHAATVGRPPTIAADTRPAEPAAVSRGVRTADAPATSRAAAGG